MISIVIPYMQQLSDDKDGEELKYAIRSWERYAGFDFEIILVGDAPEWYTGRCIKTGKVRGIPYARALDIAKKLIEIVKSDIVTEDFLYTYDDIYPITHISETQARTIISTGPINKKNPNGNTGGSAKWNQLFTDTIYNLMDLPRIYGYETHLPRMLNKIKLANLIWNYDLEHEPLLFSTLYFNEYHDNPDVIIHKNHPLKVFMGKEKNMGQFTRQIQGKTYINSKEGAWDSCLKQYMVGTHLNPSKYERNVQQKQG